MSDLPDPSLTALLARMQGGDDDARAAMVPLVYDELRRLAASYLRRERSDHTLQPTALVHEAYLRLFNRSEPAFQNRGHFMAVAAIVMRRVLVNHARARGAVKRGDGAIVESLSVVGDVAGAAPVDVLALDQALDALTALDERKGRVVELKFFGGLSNAETAAALDLSLATVERDWSFARAWLYTRLTD